jgi:hypothetical protein
MLAGTKAAPVLCHQKIASGDMTVPNDVPRDRDRRWPILITREEGYLAMTWSRVTDIAYRRSESLLE